MQTVQINASDLMHKTIDGKDRPKEEEKKVEEVKKEPEPEFPVIPWCTHPPGGKCIQCISVGEKKVEGIKHQSFEHFVSEIWKKCAGLHKPD